VALLKLPCVCDLETIEADHRIIEKARKDGLLEVTISEEVKAACDDLIATYTGDFLCDLIHIRAYPDAIDPSIPRWMRKPYTLYRDYYLQAVWYAGEFEQRVGQRYANECLAGGDESRLKQLREHWGRAAEHYWICAMRSCSSRFDLKVTFGIGKGVHGERVIISEWALRNCLLLYGYLGSTHLVDQLYSRYYRHMRHTSGKMWEPSDALLRDLQSAKENTGSCRIPKLMSSHDPPISQG
jgi:hypothetical protein